MTTTVAFPTSPSAQRGVLYVKWGSVDETLGRSIRSVHTIHPELPIHVHCLPDTAYLCDKAAMMSFTPFEETLFLDVDTVVLDRLDFGFEMAARHGLACCICENPWARRYSGIKGDLVEYNTGVLFFTKKAQSIFDIWNAKARVIDSSIKFFDEQNQLCIVPADDQGGFALAVAESSLLPFILPLNWNFRPCSHRSFFGPIKIWHDYANPPQDVIDFTMHQSKPESVIRYAWLRT